MIKLFYSFYQVILSKKKEEYLIHKILQYINIKASDNSISTNLLILITNTFIDLFYQACIDSVFNNRKQVIGFIYNNCFSESENSTMSQNICGLKYNHKLDFSSDAIINHSKNRQVHVISILCLFSLQYIILQIQNCY